MLSLATTTTTSRFQHDSQEDFFDFYHAVSDTETDYIDWSFSLVKSIPLSVEIRSSKDGIWLNSLIDACYQLKSRIE